MQAVVVIHGMGEQRPMDTINAFVRAVWETDAVITANKLPHPSQVWSKPDPRTGSLELRRITTRESIPSAAFPHGVRTDFYELYWADLTAGSTWEEFTGWVRGLLLRPLSRVPPDVRPAWIVLWMATLAVIAIAGLAVLPADAWRKIGAPWLADWHWLLAFVALAFGRWLHKAATASFGRVVRYTMADPANIAARQAVRERGLKLMNSLHEGDRYKRIIMVSHSLGTMLAHDLLSYFWAQREAAPRIRRRWASPHAPCLNPRKCPQTTGFSSEIGKRRFVSDCVVGPGGLELRARHAVQSNRSLALARQIHNCLVGGSSPPSQLEGLKLRARHAAQSNRSLQPWLLRGRFITVWLEDRGRDAHY